MSSIHTLPVCSEKMTDTEALHTGLSTCTSAHRRCQPCVPVSKFNVMAERSSGEFAHRAGVMTYHRHRCHPGT